MSNWKFIFLILNVKTTQAASNKTKQEVNILKQQSRFAFDSLFATLLL